MHLDEHPFRLLGIGTRTKKTEILERVRSLELTHDQQTIQSAAATVTHPTKRVQAEVRWFLGVRPAQLTQVLWAVECYDDLPANLEHMFGGLDPLTYLNLVYFWLTQHGSVNQDTCVLALDISAHNATNIVASEVREILNADRLAAGIPQIVDSQTIDEALTQWKHEIVDSIVSQMLKTSWHGRALSHLVEKSTKSGTKFANDFVYGIVDRYQVGIQRDLGTVHDGVREVCQEISKDLATYKSSELETLMHTWNDLTDGIQLAMKSRGLEDAMTNDLGNRIRSVAIELANEHDCYVEARRITVILQEACKHTPTLAERFSTDLEALDNLIAQKTERDNASAAEKAARDSASAEVNKLIDLSLAIRADCSEHIVREEGSADVNRKFCDTALQRFRQEIAPKLKQLPTNEKGIRRAQEAAARCISGIAIDYTWADDFVTSEKLQIEALHLAEGAEGSAGETWSIPGTKSTTATAIKDALEKVRPAAKRQRLFASLTPISSAPSLSTLNGFGCTLYGNSDYDSESQSYVATHYFVALFVPLFPLARYRVISTGEKGFRFLGKLPLRKFDQWHLGISLSLVFLLVIIGAVSNSSTESYVPPATGNKVVQPPNNSSTSPTRPTTSRGNGGPPSVVPATDKELRNLKAEIDAGRALMAALNSRLNPVVNELKSLKGPMDRLESELKSLDAQQKASNDIDVNDYNVKVDRYNSLLARYQDLLATNNADFRKSDELEKRDSDLIERYNRLIK